MRSIHKLLSLALPCLAGVAVNAAVYLVDFNTAGYSGYPDTNTWNIYDTPADVTGTLLDSGNNSSVIGISLSGADFDDTTHATASDGPFWVYNPTVTYNTEGDAFSGAAFAAYDSFCTTSTTTGMTLSISGLTGLEFSLDVLGGGTYGGTADNGYFSYSLDGGSTYTGFMAWNANGTLRYADTTVSIVGEYRARQGVTMNPGSLGSTVTLAEGIDTLYIKGVADADTGRTGISAMRLEVVPEPSTFALLFGFAAFGLVMIRRRMSNR